MEKCMETALGILFLLVFVLLPILVTVITYFLPAIVSGLRKKHDFVRILLLNLFFGWLTPLWIYVCVCAFLDNPQTSHQA